jgi:hypothetical protein
MVFASISSSVKNPHHVYASFSLFVSFHISKISSGCAAELQSDSLIIYSLVLACDHWSLATLNVPKQLEAHKYEEMPRVGLETLIETAFRRRR